MGEQIRKHRKSQNLTQEKLAEKVGVSPSFLGHVERGTRKASVESIVKISQALRVSMDTFIPPLPAGLVEQGCSPEQLGKARALLELAIRLADSEYDMEQD